MSMINYKAKHFNYKTDNGIAVISIKGAKQKNPLTFDSYGGKNIWLLVFI